MCRIESLINFNYFDSGIDENPTSLKELKEFFGNEFNPNQNIWDAGSGSLGSDDDLLQDKDGCIKYFINHHVRVGANVSKPKNFDEPIIPWQYESN